MKRLLLLGVCITGLMLVGTSQATIITTATGIDGYEWLEFDKSMGMSRLDVEAALTDSSSDLYGYRYATREETSLLLDSYFGGSLLDYDDDFYIETFDAAVSFHKDFGYTFASLPSAYTILFPNGEDQDGISKYYQSKFFYGDNSEFLTADTGFAGFVYEAYALSGTDYGGFYSSYGTDSADLSPYQWSVDFKSDEYSSLLVRESAPVPEPTTMLLFGTGIIGLAGCRRKQKK